MICRWRRIHSSSGKSAFRSRSVSTTLRPLDSPQRSAKRWMWVSTGKAGTPKACDITTLAVLCPTPGSASSSSKLLGTRPPCSSTSCCESAWMFFDFAGDSPQGRMMLRISGTRSFAIAAGWSARANSFGVTRFTRSSVHCAESTTAISSV